MELFRCSPMCLYVLQSKATKHSNWPENQILFKSIQWDTQTGDFRDYANAPSLYTEGGR